MQRWLFRVLIIEDNWKIVKQLLDIFGRYDDWKVDSALSVCEAKSQIEAARTETQPYDAYTLDIELPDSAGPGETPRITFDLHQYIREQSPRALIAYCSAHLEHPVVRRQLERPDPSTLIFNKRDTWMRTVVEELHRRLHGDPIRQELGELVQPSLTMTAGRGRFDGGPAGYSLTHKMSSLISRIRRSWNYLDDELKKELGSYFKVEETSKGVTLKLY
jgi:CheY-like chemotaxis protein